MRHMGRFFCGLLIPLLLSGCLPASLQKQLSGNDYNEQLYVNAALGFSVLHPLAWQRLELPVSSPQYRADSIRWQVLDPEHKSNVTGEMLIRSLAPDVDRSLLKLLDDFLQQQPALNSREIENFRHPSGEALRLVGHDDRRGHLIIALKGAQHDFIIAIDFPSRRFAELLPFFENVVTSFSEIPPPSESQK